MTRLMIFCILFLLVFDPQVPFLPNGVGFSFVLFFALFPPFLLSLMAGRTNFISRSAIPLFTIFTVAMLFILGRLIFNGGENFEFLLSWVKAFFVYSSVFLFLYVFYGAAQNKRWSTYVPDIILVYFLNALFNFLIGSYPDTFEFLSVFRSKVVSESLGGNPYRNSFISGSGYFSIGTAYGLAVLFVSYYFVKFHVRSFTYSLSFLVMAVSGFIAARTSFFAILFSAIYMFAGRPIYLLFISFLGVAVLSALLLLPALQPYVEWMISFFSEFQTSSSASYLLNEMYFWPGIDVFLAGRGWVNDGTYLYTDAGYMQDILFGGIFFLLIKISFVLVFFNSIGKKSVVFGALFCLSILLFHMKGAAAKTECNT